MTFLYSCRFSKLIILTLEASNLILNICIPGFRDHSDLMGRVTPKLEVSTPVMSRSRLPHDVLAQYNGRTREDLIEMVVDLKKELDGQGKKIVDLEDYIDNLLIKILDVAPILLKQDSPMMSKHHIM